MPKKGRAVPAKTMSGPDRVKYFVDTFCGGSITRAARELVLNHSVLSRVLRHGQQPGPKVLGRLADHPQISSEWAMTGRGKPTDSFEQGMLPVASCPLPGKPTANAGLLTGTQLAAPLGLYRSSRYWLVVQGNETHLDCHRLRIDSSDTLLIETDSIWPQNPAITERQLLILNLGDRGGIQLCTAKVGRKLLQSPNDAYDPYNRTSRIEKEMGIQPKALLMPDDESDTTHEKTPDPSTKEVAKHEVEEVATPEAASSDLLLDHIVGISVLLVRQYLVSD